jgi:hypothetical protein
MAASWEFKKNERLASKISEEIRSRIDIILQILDEGAEIKESSRLFQRRKSKLQRNNVQEASYNVIQK